MSEIVMKGSKSRYVEIYSWFEVKQEIARHKKWLFILLF
jgi:hypothetical protein